MNSPAAAMQLPPKRTTSGSFRSAATRSVDGLGSGGLDRAEGPYGQRVNGSLAPGDPGPLVIAGSFGHRLAQSDRAPPTVGGGLSANRKVPVDGANVTNIKAFCVAFTLYDDFVSRPPTAGASNNDVGVTFSLGWKF